MMANLALQHVDLAVLDVHVVLQLSQFALHAIAILHRAERVLRLLVDHAVLLLKSGAQLLDIGLQHVVVLLFGAQRLLQHSNVTLVVLDNMRSDKIN